MISYLEKISQGLAVFSDVFPFLRDLELKSGKNLNVLINLGNYLYKIV